MELVGMLMNNLSANMDSNRTTSSNSTNNFSQIFDNASSNSKNNTYTAKDSTTSNNSKSNVDSSKSSVYNSSNKTSSASKTTKKQTTTNTAKTSTSSDKQVGIIEQEKLKEVSEALGVSEEQVLAALSELSMSLSMLSDQENLVDFMKTALEITNPMDLLSMDNVKDMMASITDVANSIDYDDLVPFGENFEQILTNLQENGIQNVKLLTSGNEEMPQDIKDLLESLNGQIVSVKVGNETSKAVVNVADEIVEEVPEVIEEVDLSTQSFTAQFGSSSSDMQDLSQQGNQGQSQEQALDNSLALGETQTGSSKVFNASLPQTQALRNLNSTEMIAQIMEKMQSAIKANISEIHMTLNPASLGEIAIKLSSQSGVVTAQFLADNEKVKETIEANMEQLKELLAEQGIEVGELEVSLSNSEQGFNFEDGQFLDDQQNSFEDFESLELEEELEENIIANDDLQSSVNYSA